MGSSIYQYSATIIVTSLTLNYGLACGWVSPYLPYLSSDETILEAKLTIGEASLIAALLCAGGFFGNIFFAWITDKYGRKIPLMFCALPQIVGWILTLYAKNANYLYVARFIHGFAGGGIFVIVPVYISEIAEDRIRGTLGSFLVLTAALGTLMAFIFGEYCTYNFTPIFAIALSLIFLCGFYFFPESPAALFKINQMDKAEKSIRFYRNLNKRSKDEMETLQIEMKKLQLTQTHTQGMCTGSESRLRWADFTTIAARKAMLVGLVLAAVNQLCGCFAMINYTATIFRESGSTLTPNASAIVVGCIQLCGAYASVILVDRAGRKFLLGLSATATSLGLACLGTYLYLKSIGCNVEAFGWIPISCFSFVLFFAHWGVLTLPFLVISEILPEKIKNAGASICVGLLWGLSFFMVKFFPMLSDALGMHGSMYLFSIFSMAGAIFVMTVMPETKGKSFDEILQLLERRDA